MATSNGLVYIPIPDRNENGGVVPVEPGTSNCPPGSCNLLSSPYRNNKKEVIPKDDFFFGDLERTRTVDLQRDRLAC